jgi:hypothetical protein
LGQFSLGVFKTRIIAPRWLFSRGLENKDLLSPTGEEPGSDSPAENYDCFKVQRIRICFSRRVEKQTLSPAG